MDRLCIVSLVLALVGSTTSSPGYSNAGASASSYASSSASSYGGGSGSGGGGGGSGYPNYGGGYAPQGGFGQQGSFGPQGGYGQGGFGPGGFGPNQFQDFHRYLQDFLNNLQEMVRQSANAIPSCGSSDQNLGDRFGGVSGSGSGFPSSPVPSYPGGSASTGGGPNTASSSAVGSIGPGGGFGSTKVSGGDGLGDRFGGGIKEDSGPFPAPSSGNVGVSSFSSSSSSDINGKKTSQKTASVSYNDNGKVTTYTSHDP